MTLIVCIVILLALFGLAYGSRRRFGTLGLALTAGALLADQMTKDLSKLIDGSEATVAPLTTVSAASIFLILLPALILLLSGPAYKKKRRAVVGAILFALMAMLLIVGPLSASLPPDKIMIPVLQLVAQYNSIILAVFIAGAVVDAWLTHNISSSEDKKKDK